MQVTYLGGKSQKADREGMESKTGEEKPTMLLSGLMIDQFSALQLEGKRWGKGGVWQEICAEPNVHE